MREEKQEPTKKKPCHCRYCTEHRPACHDEKVCERWAEWKPEQEQRAQEIRQEKQHENYYSRIGKKKTRGHQRPSKQLQAASKREDKTNGA